MGVYEWVEEREIRINLDFAVGRCLVATSRCQLTIMLQIVNIMDVSKSLILFTYLKLLKITRCF